MGLHTLLTDLSDNVEKTKTEISGREQFSNYITLSDDYGLGNSGHTIIFNQRSMPWNDNWGASDNTPLLTFGFNGEEFDDLVDLPEHDEDKADLLRGGALNFARRGQDYVRINKWMFGTPAGAGWIFKQAGLQLMNPRLDSPQKSLIDTVVSGFTGMFGMGIKDPNQMTFNLGINTGFSVLLAGEGAIPREGAIPYVHSGYIDAAGRATWGMEGSLAQGKTGHYAEGNTPNAESSEEPISKTNRLTFLYENKIINQSESNFGLGADLGFPDSGFLETVGDIMDVLGGHTGEELFSYLGGPKSKLGLGRTRHGRYVVSNEDNYGNKLKSVLFNPDLFQSISGNTAHYSILQPPNFIRSMNAVGTYIKGEKIKHPYFNYNTKIGTEGTKTYHYESRVNTGNPGKISPIIPAASGSIQNLDGTINYKAFLPDKIDKLNALDIFKNTDGEFFDNRLRDFIKFRIEAIDNNSKASKMHSNVMVFRAFMDDVSDSYTAEHNNFKYNGRAEEFYTYKGFKRNIELSFKIAAQSRHEMLPLYRKLNYLVSNTAPDYDFESGRMRTPYIRMTVGSWMNRIPGVISSVGLKWQTDYPWEINMDGPEEKGKQHMLVLPHMLDVQLSFIPIQNFLPKKGVQTPFILPFGKKIDGELDKAQKWLTHDGEQSLDDVTEYLNKPSHERFE